MASIYKKFTTQDFATIPFNAHKQYNFDSASAADNRVTYFPTKHTSESISLYSTSSGPTGGDTINVIKYNQINHLQQIRYLNLDKQRKDLLFHLYHNFHYYKFPNQTLN